MQEDSAEKIVSIRKEKPVQFRKHSHEVQHSFNKDLEERFCEADASLARACQLLEEGAAKEAVTRAQQTIEKVKQLLTHRQKLIRIADRSELGWMVVDEDELAEDSGDEK